MLQWRDGMWPTYAEWSDKASKNNLHEIFAVIMTLDNAKLARVIAPIVHTRDEACAGRVPTLDCIESRLPTNFVLGTS